jgi:hypothetical protein
MMLCLISFCIKISFNSRDYRLTVALPLSCGNAALLVTEQKARDLPLA